MNTDKGPKIFLAAISHIKSAIVPYYKPYYILESFMDLKGKTKATEEYVKWCMQAEIFLLDSGAFTFLNKSKKSTEFDRQTLIQYIEDYILFINKWDIQYFFELDIDSVIGYDNVLKIRDYIEKKTNKKCIPVWHVSRGLNEFKKMCQEYSYVSIGGIASKEIPKKHHDLLYMLCDIAHNYGCIIHGLGYLSTIMLNENKFPFDTCDGTGWQGHMRGVGFRLNGNKIEKFKDGQYWKDCARSVFSVWTEFSKIVEKNNIVYHKIITDDIDIKVENLIKQCLSYKK